MYEHISGPGDGSQAEFFLFLIRCSKRLCREIAVGMVQESAGFPTFETVFQPSVLNSEWLCEFGKYSAFYSMHFAGCISF